MKRILIIFILLLTACTVEAEPIAVTRVVETAVPPTPPPATATAVPPTREPPAATPTAVLPLTPTPTTATDALLLTWQQKSGRALARRCHELAIYLSGEVTLSACLREERELLFQTQLTAAQLEQLKTWHDQFQPFMVSYSNNSDGADFWEQNFSFVGDGHTSVSDPQEGEIRVFVTELMAVVMVTGNISTPPTPAAPIVQLEATPVFTGGNVRLVDWSPDGRYLTYFEYTAEQIALNPGYLGAAQGTFTIYDTTTGTKCQAYPLDATFAHEGPDFGRRHLWLPNGDLFIFTQTGMALQTAVPCSEAEQDLTSLFPERPLAIVNTNPDKTLLLLTAPTRYWLYDIANQTAWPIAEIMPDAFNNLVWSPDGRYLGVTLAGNYTDQRDPVGGTRIVEVATGNIMARHDWVPMNALDGTFGGPVWLNNEEMLITVTLDQGPFFMTVAGEIRPLLPLFPIAQRYHPRADIYIEPNSPVYHILLTDFGSAQPPVSGSAQPPTQIYHSDTGEVETLETTSTEFYLRADGQIIFNNNGTTYTTRHITAVGAPFTREKATCFSFWAAPETRYYAQKTAAAPIEIWHLPDCTLAAILDLGEAVTDASYIYSSLAPNNEWLAVVPSDNTGRGATLFVLSLAEMLP
jgi:hypothetical protein